MNLCVCKSRILYFGHALLALSTDSDLSRGRGTGGALGASAPPLFVPGEKVPFFGNESALFS